MKNKMQVIKQSCLLFIWMHSLILVNAEGPTVHVAKSGQPPHNVAVLEGKSIILRCQDYEPVIHKPVAWLKGAAILLAGRDKWTLNERVSLVNLNSSDYAIQIDTVQLVDEGVYTCSFHVNQRQHITQVYLAVHEPRDVRLMGGTSHCTGRLEMKHQGEWRPVDGTSEWNQNSSSVVCRQLGCGSAVSTERSLGSRVQPVWWMRCSCVGSESSLRECVIKKSYSSTATLEVICADLLFRPNITIFPICDTDGVPEGQQVVMGSRFTISCSIQPQYPGGSFHLTFTGSNTTHNHTQPAVNHSSTFLFPAADHTHQGNYSCVYHINVFDRSFSSESRFLSLTVTQ